MTTIGPTAFAVVVDLLHAGCEVSCLKHSRGAVARYEPEHWIDELEPEVRGVSDRTEPDRVRRDRPGPVHD